MIMINIEKTCFFIGNRHAPNSIREQLKEVIKKHITDYNVTTFIVGNYGNFDRMVIGVLIELKQQNKDIKLYLLAPYALTQKVEVPKGFVGTLYPDGLEFVPLPFAIVEANRYMIKNSDYLIACPSAVGNSRKIVEFAQRREKQGLIKITLL